MHAALLPLRDAPARSAIVLDVDGTLAPIVARPELARVPDETRRTLEALRGSYGLVACLSGRERADAERLVGVPGLVYVGNHGLDLHPDAMAAAEVLTAFRDRLPATWPVEDKGLSLTIHFREAPRPDEARRSLEAVAADAQAAGLRPRWGRMVLEIRPDLDADKGTALAALLGERDLDAALYAGDDETDRDAFRALRASGPATTVAIAILSDETPAGLAEEADLSVDGPQGLAAILADLAGESAPAG